MNPRRLLLFFSMPLLAPLALAQRADVLPPVRRVPTVELATRLATPPVTPELAADLKNPFAPHATAPAPATESVSNAPARVSNRQLLESIAPLVNPTGTMMLGGEPILLFGQKRIKVGETLPITFDGKPYLLVISAIQSTSFTLRLAGEETTRPIKLATRP